MYEPYSQAALSSWRQRLLTCLGLPNTSPGLAATGPITFVEREGAKRRGILNLPEMVDEMQAAFPKHRVQVRGVWFLASGQYLCAKGWVCYHLQAFCSFLMVTLWLLWRHHFRGGGRHQVAKHSQSAGDGG